MTVTVSKVSIISNASILLGNGPVSSLSNPNKFIASASERYDVLIQSLLSVSGWRFATGIVELSQLVSTPIVDEWLYAYELPANYLAMVRLYPNTEFKIYQNRIFTNIDSPVKAEYRFVPSNNTSNSAFLDYFGYELASDLARGAAEREDIARELKQVALMKKADANFAEASSNYQDNLNNAKVLITR